MIESKEFTAGLENAANSLVESKKLMNTWLAENSGCEVISVETIYGRFGSLRAHYEGESLGIVGVRLWYSVIAGEK